MDKNEALKRAAGLCSRQEKCKSDITTKLYEWGLDEEHIDWVILALENEKFIDEKRFASFFVKDKFKINKWGKVKIQYFLQQKSIPNEYISSALDSIADEEYIEQLRQLLIAKNKQVKAKDAYDRLAKLCRYAASRGFEQDLVREYASQLAKT